MLDSQLTAGGVKEHRPGREPWVHVADSSEPREGRHIFVCAVSLLKKCRRADISSKT